MASSRSNRSNNSTDKPKSRPKPSSPETSEPSSTASTPAVIDLVGIDDLPVSVLRKYRQVHNLASVVPSALSHNGYLLKNNKPLGVKTFTGKHTTRVSKQELAAVVKKHFNQQTVRESEVVVDFIYSVNKQGMVFFFISICLFVESFCTLTIHLDDAFKFQFRP